MPYGCSTDDSEQYEDAILRGHFLDMRRIPSGVNQKYDFLVPVECQDPGSSAFNKSWWSTLSTPTMKAAFSLTPKDWTVQILQPAMSDFNKISTRSQIGYPDVGLE